MTTLKISFINPTCTGVTEYWDDIPMKNIVVRAKYEGGNIREFIENNSSYISSFNYKQMEILFI